MKMTSQLDSNMIDNLVMFPASKNFTPEADPLNDLLNEYSHMSELDVPDHLDVNFEDELEGDTFHSLEAFMNRGQLSEALSPDDKLIKMINERIEAIKEAKERIKFYLDEIEMFLPSRRK